MDLIKFPNKYFILIWIITLCFNLSHNVMNSSASLYMDALGFSESMTGWLTFAFCGAAAASRVVSGLLSDRVSRQAVMVAGCILFALSVLLFAFASAPLALIALRGFQGVGYSFVNTASAASNLDVVPENKAKRAIGLYWAANSISFGSCGIFIESAASRSYSLMFGLVTAVMAAAVVCAMLCGYRKKPEFARDSGPGLNNPERELEKQGVGNLVEKSALPAAFGMFLLCFVMPVSTVYILLYAKNTGFWHPEFFMVLCAVFMIAGNSLYPALCGRLGNKKLIAVGLSAYAAGLLLLALFPSNAAYYISAACFGIALSVSLPGFNAQAAEGVAPDRLGAASGTVFMAMDLGNGLGSLFWGFALGLAGYSAVYIISAVIIILCALASFISLSKKS